MRVAIPPAAPLALPREPAAGPIVTVDGEALGTSWTATLVGGDAMAAREIVEGVLTRIVREMSQWEPSSSLSRFNRAPAGHAQPLEPDFATVIAEALRIADESSGAFDPAMGALTELWGYGAAGPRPAPSDAEVADALSTSGHDALFWDAGARRLTKSRAVALDLAGIAKGHAVDAVADALAAAGWRAMLVEIGGEVVGRGLRPDRQPWWVDVEAIPGTRATPLRIAACDVAIATSGDYRRGCHTLSPRTGYPIAHTRAVTVIADRCLTADAWATALTVLPPDEALALADVRGLVARIVTDEEERLSAALVAMLG